MEMHGVVLGGRGLHSFAHILDASNTYTHMIDTQSTSLMDCATCDRSEVCGYSIARFQSSLTQAAGQSHIQ